MAFTRSAISALAFIFNAVLWAPCSADKIRAAGMAMIAMTTSSSMRVNAARGWRMARGLFFISLNGFLRRAGCIIKAAGSNGFVATRGGALTGSKTWMGGFHWLICHSTGSEPVHWPGRDVEGIRIKSRHGAVSGYALGPVGDEAAIVADVAVAEIGGIHRKFNPQVVAVRVVIGGIRGFLTEGIDAFDPHWHIGIIRAINRGDE